jgi:hypothetical protein
LIDIDIKRTIKYKVGLRRLPRGKHTATCRIKVPGNHFGNDLAWRQIGCMRKERTMLKPYIWPTCVFAAVLSLALLIPASAPAQGGKKGKAPEVQNDAQQRTTTEPDENIQNPSETNDPGTAPKAPADKGGEKTRAGLCHIHVDNRTPWKIQMYVNGNYAGLVPGWGDLWSTYDGGGHTMYGRARFERGPDITWGPRRISCVGMYNWRLTDCNNGYC